MIDSTVNSRRRFQCIFHGPASFQSEVKKLFTNADFFGPGGSMLYSTSITQETIVASIALLFFTGSPLAITWFVIAIIVDTFYRVIGRWPRTHVCEEVGESFRSEPALADFNSTPAVTMEAIALRTTTATDQSIESLVFGAMRHTMDRRTSHTHYDTMRMFTKSRIKAEDIVHATMKMAEQRAGGNYFHQWIGFLGAMYTLGAKRFGSHWLLHNLDINNLPGPGVAFA